jgi:hypothetical protein
MRQYNFIVLTFFISINMFFVSGCRFKEEICGSKKEVVSYYKKILGTDGSPEINIRLDSGNIEIYSWCEETVKFELTKKVRGMQKTEILKKKLDNFLVSTENEDNSIFLNVRYNEVIDNPADILSDLRVYIPKKLGLLNCKLGVGKIKIYDDLRCMLKIDVDTANININRFEGILSFKAQMGDLNIAGGRILKGSAINTGMGNILIKAEIESSGNYQFETGMGNIDLSLPEKSNIMLQYEGNLQKNEFLYSQKGALIKIKNQMGRIAVKKY